RATAARGTRRHRTQRQLPYAKLLTIATHTPSDRERRDHARRSSAVEVKPRRLLDATCAPCPNHKLSGSPAVTRPINQPERCNPCESPTLTSPRLRMSSIELPGLTPYETFGTRSGTNFSDTATWENDTRTPRPPHCFRVLDLGQPCRILCSNW